MFSQQSPFLLVIGNPSAALDELLISLSSAPLLHQLLGLFYSSSVVEALSLLNLSVSGDYLRDTVPLACWLNLSHDGHVEDTIWIWFLLFTLTQTLCATMLTVFLPEYVGILIK